MITSVAPRALLLDRMRGPEARGEGIASGTRRGETISREAAEATALF
jgi:hypothetical protein